MSANQLPNEELTGVRVRHLSLVPLSDDLAVAGGRTLTAAARRRELDDEALYNDLAAVVGKVGERIVVPDRPFTIEEWQKIRMLRSILRTASVMRTWTELTFTLAQEQVRRFVRERADRFVSLGFEQGEGWREELFGTALDLGPHRMYFRQARLANLEDVYDQLATRNLVVPVVLRFVPGQNTNLEIRFPEWGLVGEPSARLTPAERIVLLGARRGRRINQLFEERQRRQLMLEESRELARLVDEHGQRLRDRGIGRYAALNALSVAEARRQVEESYAAALAEWEALEADPERLQETLAQARRHRARADG